MDPGPGFNIRVFLDMKWPAPSKNWAPEFPGGIRDNEPVLAGTADMMVRVGNAGVEISATAAT
jgi:hypothetical protein